MVNELFYLLNYSYSESYLRNLQLKKLKSIVKYAFHNVDFYRKKFKEKNILPEDVKNLDYLQFLPLTNKKEMRQTPLKNLISNCFDVNNLLKISTSGSTGEPLMVYFDERAYRISRFLNFRVLNSVGFKPWHKRVYSLRINPKTYVNKSIFQKIGLWKSYIISPYISDIEQYRKLERINPDLIWSYPSTLLTLIKYNRKKRIRPKNIILSGEVVTPEVKKIIESNYDSNVYETYGCTEGGVMAVECYLHNGLHINSDAIILEFLNKKNNMLSITNKGRVILTNLYNFAMPFIRYDTGDIGVLSNRKCKCGNQSPLINFIEGRNNDYFTLQNGKVIDPRRLNSSFRFFISRYNKKYGWNVEKYQIIQEDINSVVVKIVKGQKFSNNDIKKTYKMIKRIMGRNVKIDVKIVNDILKTKRGKMQTVISKVKPSDLLSS
jgi:phenylacetate-CoA ligase